VDAGQPWLLLQHVPFEGPGAIAQAIADAGAPLTLLRMDRGDALPPAAALAESAGVVVMGGPMSVHDDLAWLAAERDLLRRAVEAGLPVLGVCLGAQQLAAALGATVFEGPAPECGIGEVHLTTAALDDPVFGPAPSPLPCVHWHGDTFALPDGAVRLAGNDAYENQAFRFGDRAYGLQFHVEVTASLVAHWGPHLPPGVFLRESDVAHVSRAGVDILRRFVGLAGDAAPG
jgi:GMP synthase (glutamine-hydrolysing)